MLNDERGNLDGMKFGSPHPSLFSTGCEDPRKYHGPPNPRRCMTPSGRSTSSIPQDSSVRSSSSMSKTRVLPKRGLLVGNPNGKRSVLSFDENRVYKEGAVLLDSPRSVKACLRIGISPDELLAPSFEDTIEEMKRNGEDTTDSDVVKMRYNYVVRRQKQKLKAVQDERNSVIVEESRDGPVDTTQAKREAEMSSMIEREEHRLQKIVETNKSRLRQQLLHSQLLLKQRQREDERLENQRRKDERRKVQQEKDALEKNRKEEEAQVLRNEARELERREQAARVELRRAMYEAKDKAVKERIAMNRMEIEAQNEAKRRRNMERRKMMKEQSDHLVLQRREKFKERWISFEQSRQEYSDQQEMEKDIRRAEAEKKEEKIQEAILRSGELLQAKINKTFERERLAQEKLKEHEEERKKTVEAKRQEELEKEERRKQVYADAQLKQQERVVRLTSNIKQAELRMKDMLERRSKESRLRQEVMRQRELDKQDCVERSKKMEKARVESLEDSIAMKNNKIEAMKEQQMELTEKRKLHRQEVERSRASIPEVTPGPGDYLLTDSNVGTVNPKWKFGLPSSAMGARVVSRNHPAPGYEPSPGPCRYEAQNVNDGRHKTTPAFSMTKHDRWNETRAAAVTPGPSDYAPPTAAIDGSITHIF